MPSPIVFVVLLIVCGCAASLLAGWLLRGQIDITRTRTCLLLLFALTAICYVNSFGNGFVWDDTTLIVENPTIRNWQNWTHDFKADLYPNPVTQSFYYRPLQSLSYRLDYSLWGMYPDGFHTLNIFLHAANAMLVFLLVRRFSHSAGMALACGALFAVHPIYTQAVTYISGRADPMCAFFLLLSFLTYTHTRDVFASIRDQPDPKQAIKKAAPWLLLLPLVSLAFFACALCSKEFAVIFPVLLLAFELCVPAPEGKRSGVRVLSRLLPFVVLVAAWFFVRVHVFGSASPPPSDVKTGFSPFVLCLRAMAGYVSLLIAPVNLHMEQTVAFHGWKGTQLTITGVIGWICLLGLLAIYWKRSRSVAFALLWFLIFFLPVSNLWPLNATLAEHWMYFPSIGFLWAACAAVSDLLSCSVPNHQRSARVYATLLLFVVLLFTARTIWRNLDWRDEITFYTQTIAAGGNTARVHNNLGMALQVQRKDLEGAEREYQESLNLDPQYDAALNNFGLLCQQKGEQEKALQLFQKAMTVHPWRVEPYVNVGETYGKLGRMNDAWATFADAAKRFPQLTLLAYRYAMFAREHKDLPLAETQLERCLQIDPDSAEFANALGAVAIERNEPEKAVALLNRAKQLDRVTPHPYLNLALLYQKQDRFKDAELELLGAIRIQPYNPDFHYRLGILAWRDGRTNDAVNALKKALDLYPEFASAREALEKVQKGLGYSESSHSHLDLEVRPPLSTLQPATSQ